MCDGTNRGEALSVVLGYIGFLNNPFRMAVMKNPDETRENIVANIKRLCRQYCITRDELAASLDDI